MANKVQRITLDLHPGRLFDATRELGQINAGARMLELMIFGSLGTLKSSDFTMLGIYGVQLVSVAEAPDAERTA